MWEFKQIKNLFIRELLHLKIFALKFYIGNLVKLYTR